MAAFTTQGSGHYDKAVEEGLKAIELDPNYAIGYDNVTFAYIYQNRLPEAEALLRKAAERKIATIEFSLCRYFIAFLRNDQAAMEKEVTQRQAKLEAQGWFEHQEALTIGLSGPLERSGPAIGPRGELIPPGRFARAGRPVYRRSRCMERAVRDSGGGAKKRGCGDVALPQPGCRLWTGLCAGASA